MPGEWKSQEPQRHMKMLRPDLLCSKQDRQLQEQQKLLSKDRHDKQLIQHKRPLQEQKRIMQLHCLDKLVTERDMQPTDLDLGKTCIRQHSHMTSHCTIRTTLKSTLEG